MALGSSTKWAKTGGCGCMNTKDDPAGLDADCNCLYMPYGDGASFSGYRAEPWPVPGTNTTENPEGETLTFRGIKNIDATVAWALKNGLKDATEFVLTGGSAGGLSTFLHADRVGAKVEAAAPACKKIRAAPVVGYFLDHDNFAHDSASAVPNTPSWNHANYTKWMRYIYKMQNMTFGEDGGLTKACEEKHPGEPGLCFMSPHMQDVIKTPFFMCDFTQFCLAFPCFCLTLPCVDLTLSCLNLTFPREFFRFNSKYDAWQLGSEFQSNWKTKAEQAGVLQYGKDFMTQLAPVYTDGETKNGGMITSCICHGCPWGTLQVNDGSNKTSYEHYADWMDGKTTGAASMHIDTRLPNGGGTLIGKDWAQCKAFPDTNADRSIL